MTPGASQMPYITACAGGKPAKAGDVVVQSCDHPQKTTPPATAMTDATTMSTVRQRRRGCASSTRVPVLTMTLTPFAGITQSRFKGLRTNRTLSAQGAPLSYVVNGPYPPEHGEARCR